MRGKGNSPLNIGLLATVADYASASVMRWEPQLNDYDRQLHLGTLLQFALRVVIVVFAAGTLLGEPAERPYVDLCGYLGALCRDRRFLERVGATGRITGGDAGRTRVTLLVLARTSQCFPCCLC